MSDGLVNWQSVAVKDFRDALRTRLVYLFTALFTILSAGASFLLVGGVGDTGNIPTELIVQLVVRTVQFPAAVIVSGAALVVSYGAIAGERDSGSIKLLLSLPHTRADVFVGKLVGRGAVVATAVLIGTVATLAVAASRIGVPSVTMYALTVVATVLLALAFVAIGVAASSTTDSSGRALYLAGGIWVLFVPLWGFLTGQLQSRAGDIAGDSAARFVRLLGDLGPGSAYANAVNEAVAAGLGASGVAAESPAAGPVSYLVLVLWIVVPTLLGYLRFREVDL